MKVKNWEVWQSFRKDRGSPPWIKLHRNLFSNTEWMELTDAEKGQLISIWLLAADKSGTIPDSPTVIQKMCMLDTPPNLNKFIELEFLLPSDGQVVVKARSSGCQVDEVNPHIDPPEESRGEESRGEESIVEGSGKPKRFEPPTQKQVFEIMTEKGLNEPDFQSQKFIAFYESKNWMVGKNKMSKWKSSVANWVLNAKKDAPKNEPKRRML